ncbi:MAG: hypothetical protein ACFBSG_12650 [Leptolyngbyaceae cyanobacterium]
MPITWARLPKALQQLPPSSQPSSWQRLRNMGYATALQDGLERSLSTLAPLHNESPECGLYRLSGHRLAYDTDRLGGNQCA